MKLLALVAALAFSAAVFAEPLIPTIAGHDFNFGAYNQDDSVEYATLGLEPDTLIYTASQPDPGFDHEVSAYWPNWPDQPMIPVWDLDIPPSFGGDFVLAVQFTGQDAPIGDLDVSLTGTGLSAGADLEIHGKIDVAGVPLAGLLWALDLAEVALYGYADDDSYVLEGTGTIVGGLVAEYYGLIESIGAMRGHLDFIDRPDGWFPPEYDPVGDPREDFVRAAYSGETGVVPEPVAIGLLVCGLVGLIRPR